MIPPNDEQVFKCLVVAEQVGLRRWRASATVSVSGRAVAAATSRRASKSSAVAHAGEQALRIAGRIPKRILYGEE